MKQRFTTTMAAVAAAGLTAIAVTAAAPAADDEGDGNPIRRAKVVQSEGPTPEALTSCLAAHGATGVPPADEAAGRALKEWIATHQDDASVRRALKACDVYFADKGPKQGVPEAVTCGAPANAKATAAEKRAAASGASAARE